MKVQRGYPKLFRHLNTMKFYFYVLVFCSTSSVFAQVKGKVVDENNQPIPYVNISVERENIGTTSEEDGTFSLNIKQEKNLIFSALGYEKKTILSSEVSKVTLKATVYALNEVVVLNKKETKTLEIGLSDRSIHQAFENGPRIDAKFFPYQASYKKLRYLKKISIFTENALETATVKIHFYAVDAEGLPGEELLSKPYLAQVKKGSKRTMFDISDLNLSFPKEGLFVSVERLLIEKNKLEKTVAGLDGQANKTQRTYYPLLFYNYVERPYAYTFYGGSWHKENKTSGTQTPQNITVFEPAITLILTN